MSIDVGVIIKDAEIELNNNNNNNEALKIDDKSTQSHETMVSSDEQSEVTTADETGSDGQERDESGSQSSLNMDNGTESESNASNEPAEGETKVNQVSDNDTDVKTDTSDSSSATGTESKDDHPNDAELTSVSSENVSEEVNAKSADASEHHDKTEMRHDDTVSASVAATIEDEQRDSDTNEQLSNKPNGNDDNTGEEKTDEQATTSDEAAQGGSTQKSPRKKSSNKKRKNRTRSQKKEFDYSELTKYTVNVSQRQRRYFVLPARGRNVPVPSDDCEIFCSNIPINVLEGELIPLFERYGKIWELRLMMSLRNPKRNAGFAFVRFTSNESANEATEKLENYEIVPGKHLSVRLSQPNLSLFVGNIHRGLTREQIHEKISSRTDGKLHLWNNFLLIYFVFVRKSVKFLCHTLDHAKFISITKNTYFCLYFFYLDLYSGLVKTFVKSSLYEETKNCGFCFLEYDTHSSALKAKRLLNRGNVWGRQLFVDWAQRRQQPDESNLSDSKTLFINYLPKETTDEQITEVLGSFGAVEKVTKIKDYAFVLFGDHQEAADAMNGADKTKLGNEAIEISLAMPKSMKMRTRRPSIPYRQPNRRYRRNQSFNQFKPAFGSSNKFHSHKQNRNKNDRDVAANNDRDAAGTAPEQTTNSATAAAATAAAVEQTTIPAAEQTTIPASEQTMIPSAEPAMVATPAETLVN